MRLGPTLRRRDAAQARPGTVGGPSRTIPFPPAPRPGGLNPQREAAPDSLEPRLAHEPRAARYLPGLDGLRAFAVVAVLLYHSSLGIAPAGFLGVEVFFVISGFIITTGLLADRERHGRIALRSFWARRARRLLPALILLLATVLAYEELFEPAEVAALRGDVLAALGYITNWRLIITGQSYFDSFVRPPLLRHLWSLAIEEQFYILWPLILSAALAILRPAGVKAFVVTGALASSLTMLVLWDAGSGVSRVYYGTDTRVAGLLVGASLALLMNGKSIRPAFRNLPLDALGVAALATLTMLVFTLHEADGFLYRGGFLLVDVITALVILAAVQPRGLLPRMLGWRPIRWIGVRSYGIYLWHWPIFMLTRPGIDVPLHGVPLVALQFAATFVVAASSYHYVERPVREGSLGRAWESIRTRRLRGNVRVLTLSSAAAAFAAAVLVVSTFVSDTPEQPAYFNLTSVRIGAGSSASTSGLLASENLPRIYIPAIGADEIEISDVQPENASVFALGSPPRRQAQLVASATTAPEVVAAPSPPPAAEPPTAAPASVLVTAIGDSVMLGAAQQLVDTIPGIDVDAAVSRAMISGIEVLRRRAASGQLGKVILLHLGNNGPISDDQIDEVFSVVGAATKVVFINLKVPRAWEEPNNAVLARGVARHPNAVLVDWKAATADRTDVFWSDDMHLRPEGAAFYVSLVGPYLSARK